MRGKGDRKGGEGGEGRGRERGWDRRERREGEERRGGSRSSFRIIFIPVSGLGSSFTPRNQYGARDTHIHIYTYTYLVIPLRVECCWSDVCNIFLRIS